MRRRRTLPDGKFCGECGAALERARQSARAAAAPAAAGRAAARLRALRRPGRVHDRVGGPRRRGDARAAVALLRHVPPPDRALRRHGREVHRRRGDGRLGHARRDRRTTPSGPCAPRSTSSPPCPRSATRWARRPARARRRPHRRGRSHARRGGPGHGRRRPRQHRLAHPVGRGARHGARRRVDAARDGGGDRVRGRRVARAEGQGRAVPLWRALRVVVRRAAARSSRPGSRRRSSAATRELRLVKELFHASADERRAHLVSVTGIAGIGKSRLAWEFYKYFDGLAELDRTGTAAAASPTARASPTGRSPRWCGCAAGIAEDEEPDSARAKLARDARGAPRRPGRARVGRAAPRAPARPRGAARRRPAGPLRRLAAVLRAARRASTRRSSSSRTCSGRTTSAARLRRVPARLVAQPPALRAHARPARARRAPAGLGRGAAELHAALPRAALRARRWTRSSTGSFPGLPASLRDADPRARARASRSTRWRPCGCCSTAALLVQDGASTGRPATIDDARGAGDPARADRGAARRPLARGAAARSRTRAVLGKTFTEPALAASPGRGGRARAAARVARPQGGALAPGRPALARARPVRLPAGPRPPCRLRDALAPGAEGAPPRRGRPTSTSASATRTKSPRSSRRTTSPRSRPRPTPTTPRRSAAKARGMLDRAGERAVALAAALRRCATSGGRPSSRTSRARRRSYSISPGRPP